MNEFNFRTSVNEKIEMARAEALMDQLEAKKRQKVRHLRREFRQSATAIAIDAALAGAVIASFVILLACMVG